MKKMFWQRGIALGTAATMAVGLTACGDTGHNAQGNAGDGAGQSSAAEKPNIVYIVLDDMGYSDLGCYGSSIHTPNIDKLAQDGIQYTNYFTTPLSSPSRASLLTGCDANSVGVGSVMGVDFGELAPNIYSRMSPEYGTVADTLQANGYHTMAVGKWHLGQYEEFGTDGDRQQWPEGMGFEEHYTFVGGQMNQLDPGAIIENGEFIEADASAGDYHFTNDMVDKSLEYIDSGDSSDPFFLYFATGAMHAPLQVHESYIEKYDGVFDEGWDVEREKRFERQKELGLIPEDAQLPPREEKVPAWDSLTEEQKAVATRHMEVYAGFLEHTDEQIGRLIDELKARGEYDNTIFVLVSDNGANSNGAEYGNYMSSASENCIVMPVDQQYDIMDEFGGEQFGTVYNSGWASASNAPFRMFKQTAFYGGVRVPLIVTWPDGIQQPGRTCDELVYVSDITPTIYDTVGVEPLQVVDNQEVKPVEGLSFKETFESADGVASRDELFILMFNHFSYMKDGYIISYSPQTKWEMFDFKNDPTQVNNLKDEMPEKFEELFAMAEEAKKTYNSQNLIVDLAQGLPVETLLERYGETAQQLLDFVKNGTTPTDATVQEYAKILRAATIDPGAGYPGVVTRWYKNSQSKHSASDYTYQKADGKFYSLSSAPVGGVSHTISTTIQRDSTDQQGVLVANGGNEGGYVLYIQDNHLIYESNFANDHYVVRSSQELPEGTVDIAFHYQKKGFFDGTGSLMVNGEQVAQEEIKILPMYMSYDYFSIGEDAASLVTSNYSDRFTFEGEVTEIKIHMENDRWESGGKK